MKSAGLTPRLLDGALLSGATFCFALAATLTAVWAGGIAWTAIRLSSIVRPELSIFAALATASAFAGFWAWRNWSREIAPAGPLRFSVAICAAAVAIVFALPPALASTRSSLFLFTFLASVGCLCLCVVHGGSRLRAVAKLATGETQWLVVACGIAGGSFVSATIRPDHVLGVDPQRLIGAQLSDVDSATVLFLDPACPSCQRALPTFIKRQEPNLILRPVGVQGESSAAELRRQLAGHPASIVGAVSEPLKSVLGLNAVPVGYRLTLSRPLFPIVPILGEELQ